MQGARHAKKGGPSPNCRRIRLGGRFEDVDAAVNWESARVLSEKKGEEKTERERETRHYQTITTWMATSYHVASKSFNTLQQNEEHAKETKPEITFECLVMSA